ASCCSGPPGTGKSLIGRCIASVSGATFFNISASSLTSKWVGEGRLAAVGARSESEHESSRRMKTEFLVQLDGIGTEAEERLLVIGATNRPQELDDAARRRFVKRLYIPLPEAVGRRQIVERMLVGQSHSLAEADIEHIVTATDGYSGADVANLWCARRRWPGAQHPLDRIRSISVSAVRPIGPQDFEEALTQARASVLPSDLVHYANWNQSYGSYRRMAAAAALAGPGRPMAEAVARLENAGRCAPSRPSASSSRHPGAANAVQAQRPTADPSQRRPRPLDRRRVRGADGRLTAKPPQQRARGAARTARASDNFSVGSSANANRCNLTLREMRKQRRRDMKERFGAGAPGGGAVGGAGCAGGGACASSGARYSRRYLGSRIVFDPAGQFIHWWCTVVSLAFLYNLWVILFRVAFMEIEASTMKVWFPLDYTMDLIYLLDIAVSFRTGYLEDGVLQTDQVKMRLHYMDSTRFYIDCLCMLPLDLLYLSFDFQSIVRAFRLCKVYKFFQFLDRTERHANYPNLIRSLKLGHYLMLIIHTNACVLKLVIQNNPDFLSHAHLHNDSWRAELWYFPNPNTSRVDEQYLFSLYWSSMAVSRWWPHRGVPGLPVQPIEASTMKVWFPLDYTMDLIYLLDIAVSFRTGYLEDGVLQTDQVKMRLHYMDSTRFYIDCLCMLPLDLLYLSFDFQSIVRAFRLCKVYKFFQFLDRTERHANYPNLIRSLKLGHYLMLILRALHATALMSAAAPASLLQSWDVCCSLWCLRSPGVSAAVLRLSEGSQPKTRDSVLRRPELPQTRCEPSASRVREVSMSYEAARLQPSKPVLPASCSRPPRGGVCCGLESPNPRSRHRGTSAANPFRMMTLSRKLGINSSRLPGLLRPRGSARWEGGGGLHRNLPDRLSTRDFPQAGGGSRVSGWRQHSELRAPPIRKLSQAPPSFLAGFIAAN
uniref:Ion_trans domain-containing protein n=1 Tax=Macrostomum lignano TaxID=282301 RepID=A0A1I8I344_9PLAT